MRKWSLCKVKQLEQGLKVAELERVPEFHKAEICVSALASLPPCLATSMTVPGPAPQNDREHVNTFFHIVNLDTFEVSLPPPPLPTSTLIFFSLSLPLSLNNSLHMGLHKSILSEGKVNLNFFKQIENVLVHVTGKS